MVRTRIILAVVSVALIAGLFMLPKVVVENDNAISQAPEDSIRPHIEMHSQVPGELSAAIKNLRALAAANPEKEKNAIFADSLADLYATAGKFDSAAWFAESASTFFNTLESWTRAGDLYYQAYSFAVDKTKQSGFALRAQENYNKVLAKNPNNLDVKTKLAMTHLTEANPMKAIGMLREVLAQDPANELALFNMGMLSIQSGQYDRAIERLDQLLKVNPKHVQGNLLLGIAYLESGNKRKAREQFEKVKLLDTDPSVHAAADSYLKDLK
jgi:tetratricopeptide (TPR) repeat protein